MKLVKFSSYILPPSNNILILGEFSHRLSNTLIYVLKTGLQFIYCLIICLIFPLSNVMTSFPYYHISYIILIIILHRNHHFFHCLIMSCKQRDLLHPVVRSNLQEKKKIFPLPKSKLKFQKTWISTSC